MKKQNSTSLSQTYSAKGQKSQLLKNIEEYVAKEQISLSTLPITSLVNKFEKCIEQTRKLITDRKSCMPKLKEELQKFIKITTEKVMGLINIISEIQSQEYSNKSFLQQENDKIDLKYLSYYQPLLQEFKNFIQAEKEQLSTIQKCVKKLEGDCINYKLIETLECNPICNCIQFNKQNSIMVQGQAEKIKIWKFKSGQLYDSRILQGHTQNVQCLNFSQKQNLFVSGGMDQKIKIWREISDHQWKNTHTLSSVGSIQSLLLNKDDSQLLSSSADQIIRVWSEKDDIWICSQTLDNHVNHVYQLSFNESYNSFLSCSYDKNVIIWQIDQNQQWKQIQSIKNQSYSYRACFIQDNQIAIQQNGRRYVDFFTKVKGLFVKAQQVELPFLNTDMYSLCPFQFIVKRQLLLVKHNEAIYILRRKQNWRFQVEESIQGEAYGSLTNDGSYLILWDKNKKQLKIFEQVIQ